MHSRSVSLWLALSLALFAVGCGREFESPDQDVDSVIESPAVEDEAPEPSYESGPIDEDQPAPEAEFVEEVAAPVPPSESRAVAVHRVEPTPTRPVEVPAVENAEPVIAEVNPIEGDPKERAFDSSAWNSAIGLGGGSASRIGARARLARSAETYAEFTSHGFVTVADAPLSTFAADVDTASFANARRYLLAGSRPPADAVRVEEFVNYFRYAAPPADDRPFAVHTVVGPAPWNPHHWLLRVQVCTAAIDDGELPPRNLVCLVDVSGSMRDAAKLPLLQRALGLLVDQLRPIDRLAIVTYAGDSRVALPPTPGDHREVIRHAIESLSANGRTHASAGIHDAYALARQHHEPGVLSRVLLATDGDFNVGVTDLEELTALIERERASGVFLSVLGLGTGNLQDATMERLADRGNGNYSYVDNIAEARRVLVTQAGGTLITVAKDVKLQLEFNPHYVRGYRQIGYENRELAARDFNDDKKDAGEVGAGHSVTALYELVPHDAPWPDDVDPLRYQPQPAASTGGADASQIPAEIATVKVRHQPPAGGPSELIVHHVAATDLVETFDAETKFAVAVAAFGQLLRGSPHLGAFSFGEVLALARAARGEDASGERSEFLRLVQMAADL